MPRIAEINGGIDIWVKRFKTTLETLFSFFKKIICKVDQKFLQWGENYAGASRPSCLFSNQFRFKVSYSELRDDDKILMETAQKCLVEYI